MKGYIFDIRRFALYDGPGIRTTVFFKGCPLRCVWCHNPEGFVKGKNIWIKDERCIGCGDCSTACPEGALCLKSGIASVQRERCVFCGKCHVTCPSLAIQRIDRKVDVNTLVDELLRDKLFADISSGGVTLSGGEPLYQPDFALELLKQLKQNRVNTCIETSLAVPQDVVKSVAPYIDHMLVDLKLIDKDEHMRYTGIPNIEILDNFRVLAENYQNIVVRIPLIPGITALEKNLVGIVAFVDSCAPNIPIELINYNTLAPNKYRLLDMEYLNSDLNAFSPKEMDEFARLIKRRDLS